MYRSILSLSLLLGACAAQSEELDEVSEDLSARSALVGRYSTPTPLFNGFVQLTLKGDGTYLAKRDPGAQTCAGECYNEESGRFRVRPGSLPRLTLSPASGASRTFDALLQGNNLRLRRGAASETLARLGALDCARNLDCAAGYACAPNVTTIACSASDPSCGLGRCVPSAPSPPPVCLGAWLNEAGVCLGTRDEPLPTGCCAP
jgi:hypothetical protein